MGWQASTAHHVPKLPAEARVDLGSPRALAARGWERVTTGESGAIVLRSRDGSRYAKFVTSDNEAALKAERDRVQWAGVHGIPAAQVLDWATSSESACLLTSAVTRVPDDRLQPDGR